MCLGFYQQVYVMYCEHQGKLDRLLKKLKETKTSAFCQALEILEQDPVCCGECRTLSNIDDDELSVEFKLIFVFFVWVGLSLHSFLMLPMQRITRLPLLLDAVLSKLKPNDDEYDSWKMTLALLNKVRKITS